jgi:hypothetical protein
MTPVDVLETDRPSRSRKKDRGGQRNANPFYTRSDRHRPPTLRARMRRADREAIDESLETAE